jgi:hypothetical protein
MPPIALFGIQFTLSLVIYSLVAAWYVAPRLAGLPRDIALAPLLWVHAAPGRCTGIRGGLGVTHAGVSGWGPGPASQAGSRDGSTSPRR